MARAPPRAERVKLSALERLALLLLLGTLAVLGLTLWGGPSPAIPPAVIKSRDSLRATAPAFDSALAAQLATADRQAATDRRLAARAWALQALSDTLRARKDSLAHDAAQHPDSALAWRVAYVAADSEATALRVMADTLRARVDTLEAARDSLFVVVGQVRDRLEAANRVGLQLSDAITKLTTCRWGGPLSLPCPSRRASLVMGLTLGAAGVIAAK